MSPEVGGRIGARRSSGVAAVLPTGCPPHGMCVGHGMYVGAGKAKYVPSRRSGRGSVSVRWRRNLPSARSARHSARNSRSPRGSPGRGRPQSGCPQSGTSGLLLRVRFPKQSADPGRVGTKTVNIGSHLRMRVVSARGKPITRRGVSLQSAPVNRLAVRKRRISRCSTFEDAQIQERQPMRRCDARCAQTA
jgi:hypothetical protein